ncbi:RING-H2 finger protein atl66 [Phtheirospermum japonicum]|uniref:RING-type E3 ubiquitin transferase n=1 Tax=Phtheirospermum japonicum TaxID=374723 RepID=A0A830CRL2_9LAMI|nr:RING-H2 finger protein atl66 [Phtheirospermum japonicum]
MSSQNASQWLFDDGGGAFQIRGRTLLSIAVLLSVIIGVTFLFLYARFVCRLVSPPPPPPPPSQSATFDRHLAIENLPPPLARGLDLATINNMPIVLFRNLAAGGFSEAECCICLGIFGGRERVKVLPGCRHRFHSECVDKWLAAEPSCPLCRAALRDDSPG